MNNNKLEPKVVLICFFWAFVLVLLLHAASLWAGQPEQMMVYGGRAEGAPWYVTAAIVCAPGGIAMLLTVASGVMVKRVNRAMGNEPLSVLAAIKWTLAFGALWGPMVAWGFGELVFDLTGVPTSWKLIVIAPAITGVASMIGYDLLRWWTKSRYPGLYALLSVKHGNVTEGGDDNAGDLTRAYKAQGAEDPTDPRR